MGEKVNKLLLGIFSDAVNSVKPKNLIKEHFHYNKNDDKLKLFTDVYDLKSRDVYLVGAGKAVLQMATEVENALAGRLKSAIISIPMGITERYPVSSKTVIKYYEGAENNIPDEKSEHATNQIKHLVEKLDEKSFLLVLLSGGGSALLTSAIPPVSLGEKSKLIKELSKAGADIVEMNIVRKRLSSIKGGKLSELAYPAEVVSLLISDIVGNNTQSIASGPTFKNDDDPSAAIDVVKKYSLQSSLPDSIRDVLYSNTPQIASKHSNVSNYVLGNNTGSVEVARIKALSEGFNTFVLTDRVHGDVEEVSREYCLLVSTIVKLLSKSVTKNTAKTIMKNLVNIPFNDDTLESLPEVVMKPGSNGICLIAGGEPTVVVRGSGKGGRNQHLALSFSNNFHMETIQFDELKNFHISILSAGTDGMDGPTDAAGALGYGNLINDAQSQNLPVESYLSNNDSYNFYDKFSDSKYHIKIGHTNTNVMDIHIIVIKPNNAL